MTAVKKCALDYDCRGKLKGWYRIRTRKWKWTEQHAGNVIIVDFFKFKWKV